MIRRYTGLTPRAMLQSVMPAVSHVCHHRYHQDFITYIVDSVTPKKKETCSNAIACCVLRVQPLTRERVILFGVVILRSSILIDFGKHVLSSLYSRTFNIARVRNEG